MENDKNLENNNSNFFNENSLNFKQIDLKKNIKKVFMIIKIIFIFCAVPFLLVGTIFVSVSGYNIISNSNKTKGYLKTNAVLVDQRNCQDGVCEAIYEYSVNGKTYQAIPDELSNNFEKERSLKYNPDNPEQYVIDSNWGTFLIIGSLCLVVPIVEFIIMKKVTKNIFNKLENIKEQQSE